MQCNNDSTQCYNYHKECYCNPIQCHSNQVFTTGLNQSSQLFSWKAALRQRQQRIDMKQLNDHGEQSEIMETTAELRKKFHQCKSQNFSLKQELSKLRKHNLQLESTICSLKTQIQQNLNELTVSDSEILKLKLNLNQSIKYGQFLEQNGQFLEQNIQSLQDQLNQSHSVIQGQSQYITNLNQENLLLIEMKEVFIKDNQSLKASCQQISCKYEMKEKEIQKLNIELEYLFKDISNLQDLLKNKNQQILTYELFLNTKDQQIQHQQHLQTLLIEEKFAKKVEKYRKKALRYRQERDQLLAQIEEAKQEIDTITLRKYLDSDTDTPPSNYSFQKPTSHHSSSGHLH